MAVAGQTEDVRDAAAAVEGVELRRDPITNTWVLQVSGEPYRDATGGCPLCPGERASSTQTVYEHPYGSPDWQVRVIPHLHPLYRIEGRPERRGEGVYDRMRNLGAHEIVIEHRDHAVPLSHQSEQHIAQVLKAYASRIIDLKKDPRFRYVTAFRNQGAAAGQELDHPHSEITATPFVPRRVIYELRSSQRYYQLKERCVTCDLLTQELAEQVRTVEWDDMFAAFCPYASRVPYETWVLPINHHCSFEEDLTTERAQLRLARLLKSVLRRLEAVAPAYHLVLHTSPNVNAKFDRTGNWQTLSEDYHWHIEILPVIPSKSKSYSLKETYYNSLAPEKAARELRKLVIEPE
jgi:UDPglucose--hexose-1-phosphate uridylyltransferase